MLAGVHTSRTAGTLFIPYEFVTIKLNRKRAPGGSRSAGRCTDCRISKESCAQLVLGCGLPTVREEGGKLHVETVSVGVDEFTRGR